MSVLTGNYCLHHSGWPSAICSGGVLVGRLYGLAYVSAGGARDAAYWASGFGRSLHRSTLLWQ